MRQLFSFYNQVWRMFEGNPIDIMDITNYYIQDTLKLRENADGAFASYRYGMKDTLHWERSVDE